MAALPAHAGDRNRCCRAGWPLRAPRGGRGCGAERPRPGKEHPWGRAGRVASGTGRYPACCHLCPCPAPVARAGIGGCSHPPGCRFPLPDRAAGGQAGAPGPATLLWAVEDSLQGRAGQRTPQSLPSSPNGTTKPEGPAGAGLGGMLAPGPEPRLGRAGQSRQGSEADQIPALAQGQPRPGREGSARRTPAARPGGGCDRRAIAGAPGGADVRRPLK